MDSSLFPGGDESGQDEFKFDETVPKKIVKSIKPPAKKGAAASAGAKSTGRTLTQSKLNVKPAVSKTTASKTAASKKRAISPVDDENSDAAASAKGDTDSLLSITPPKEKKARAAPAAKKTKLQPLQALENDSTALDEASMPAKKEAGATQRYQKLSQLEHILKRPDTYIGSVERTERQMWVFNSQTEAMEMRAVSFVPGLYKIFDEILVNAADNKHNDKNMDTIKVSIDRAKGEISVWNNGRGIPIEKHETEKIWIPEMIFGHLLTSSNYDDDQQKVTGGRNGYGAKLCNIFSTEFTVETADSLSKQKYRQTWRANMSDMGKARITANKNDNYTQVTFQPDLAKFGMSEMDDDFEALVKRRVYDLAGTLHGVKLHLNGERVKVRNFKQYVEMYVKAIHKEQGGETATPDASPTILTDTPDPRWEIGFAVSDGSFQQVSFVNSIATTNGGTHVNHVADQIVTRLLDIVMKKNKNGPTLKHHQIRNHIFLFINCQVVNPAFTSQTKEHLTTTPSKFGSKCVVSDDFLKKVAKTDAVANILQFAQQRADQILKKTDGQRRARMNDPKLVDANKAGTKDGWKCTLILTEGDSAKGLAMAGRAVIGPDEYGVFPLRGKLLNVRDASVDVISKNVEIQAIKQFLGLQHKKEYSDARGLRYGHIMIMTDQDHDGSHIKGLLINFLQCAFPSLLRIPQFLIEFITPIVKVWKGDPKRPKVSRSFFTIPEYEAWKQEHSQERAWEHKYYKGLGTSTTEDAQVYFRDLDRHLKEFHTMKEHEEQLIDLAFNKKKADERKEWLRQFKPGTYLDHSMDKISYADFINRELILFSMADNMRSIPSVIDGLKPGQRKVLYTCFKRNLTKDMKVVELAGLVSGLTAYHHGEASLQGTIVGLAQTFVGSNNINCLEPSGNFGTRLKGGSDSASARYIYTRLSPFARRIFSPLDEALLTYHQDDNKQIEPEMYCPVVPLVLINGADGIGTGWSSQIPNYNPEDIVANLRRLMDGEPQVAMTPWFRGWAGGIQPLDPGRYRFSGTVRATGPTQVEITELPVRMWTQDFKDKLEENIRAEKTPAFITDYTDYNTHVQVHFIVQMEEKQLQAALREGLEEKFKLTKIIATTNLVAFDQHGRLHKYQDAEEIMAEFYAHRLHRYQMRKAHQLAQMNQSLRAMTNQARFIQMIIDGTLVVSKKKKAVLVAELRAKQFEPFPKVADASKAGELEAVLRQEEDDDNDETTDASAYDYLLGMAIWSLTQERIEKLRRQIGAKEAEFVALSQTEVKDLWRKDLDDFIHEWRFQLDDEARYRDQAARLGRRVSGRLGLGAKAKPRANKAKAAKADPDDGDFVVAATTKGKKKTTTAASKPPPPPPIRVPASGAASFFAVLSPTTATAKPAAIRAGTTTTTTTAAPSAVAGRGAAASKTTLPAAGTSKKKAVAGRRDPVSLDDDPDVVVVGPVRAPTADADTDADGNGNGLVHADPRPRAARAAASKKLKYEEKSGSESESEAASDDGPDGGDGNGEDMIGKMVRGIGMTTTTISRAPAPAPAPASKKSPSTVEPTLKTGAAGSRPTATRPSRPGLVQTIQPALDRDIHVDEDDVEEMDEAPIAAAAAAAAPPAKPTALKNQALGKRASDAMAFSDDEFGGADHEGEGEGGGGGGGGGIGGSKRGAMLDPPSKKARGTTTTKAKATKVKTGTAATGATKKAAAPAAKKNTTTAANTTATSAAAAKKQKAGQAAPSDGDSDGDGDDDLIITSATIGKGISNGNSNSNGNSTVPSGRPARRAAATSKGKGKYVAVDSDEEDEAGAAAMTEASDEEDSFEVPDDDSDF
ncbi:MAG: DNA topoisomerase 2 [Phylliscum demangeonii]|nr:MAG: DNA topoisomerase 2 [Phylliscum demangeonii]